MHSMNIPQVITRGHGATALRLFAQCPSAPVFKIDKGKSMVSLRIWSTDMDTQATLVYYPMRDILCLTISF